MKPMKGGCTRLKECWDCGRLAPCGAYICIHCSRVRSRLYYRECVRMKRGETEGKSNAAARILEELVTVYRL